MRVTAFDISYTCKNALERFVLSQSVSREDIYFCMLRRTFFVILDVWLSWTCSIAFIITIVLYERWRSPYKTNYQLYHYMICISHTFLCLDNRSACNIFLHIVPSNILYLDRMLICGIMFKTYDAQSVYRQPVSTCDVTRIVSI